MWKNKFGKMDEGFLEEKEDSVVLSLTVSPGAPRFELKDVNPWRNTLKVSVSSPPEGGKANDELLEELSSVLGRELRILSGSKSRQKKVLVMGASKSEVLENLDL